MFVRLGRASGWFSVWFDGQLGDDHKCGWTEDPAVRLKRSEIETVWTPPE